MSPRDSAQGFAIERCVEGRWTRLRVRGEVDMATAARVTQAVGAEFELGRPVLLDLCAVSFMDSTGIGMLVGSVQVAESAGLELVISNDLHAQVRRVLELTGVINHLPWTHPEETRS